MIEYAGYLLLGLGSGAVIAGLALGLVLTYRASGVVNFAHAATGMYLAFAFYELRETGNLVLPILGLPSRVHIVDTPTVVTAFMAIIVLSAIVGLLVYALVFRPLRAAPSVAKVAASLGLLLYFQAVVQLRFDQQGASNFSVTSVLPGGGVDVFGVRVPVDRFVLAGLVLAVTALLWTIFRFTRFGLSTRAAAESEKGALLVGLAPDRLAAWNWMAATMLAGAAIILTAPVAGLNSTTTSLLIVPALAALLLGNLSSFPATAIAGLTIGMAQSVILRIVTTSAWIPEWVPRGGVQAGLPFLVILVVMARRGDALPTRDALAQARFPESRRPVHPIVLVAVLGVVASVGLLTFDSNARLGLIVSLVSAVVCLSYVVLTGFVGQISVAQMAIAGIAGFMTANLSVDHGIGFPFAPLLAIGIATGIGLLAGLPAVRLRGMNLAIATLAFAVAVEELVFKSTAFSGGLGGTRVPRPELLGFDLGIGARGTSYPRVEFGFFVLAILLLATFAVLNLRRSRTGLRWLAVRANERAAAAAGIDVRGSKLAAFAVSSALAGTGGVLLAYERQTLSVDSFSVLLALAFLALTYLGGISGVGGAIFAGVLATGGILAVSLEDTAVDFGKYQYAWTGVSLILTAVFNPEGIIGAWHRGATRVRRSIDHATGRGEPAARASSEVAREPLEEVNR
ncbi:MAG: ABC transporter permease [Acidimicrobiia bacterium]